MGFRCSKRGLLHRIQSTVSGIVHKSSGKNRVSRQRDLHFRRDQGNVKKRSHRRGRSSDSRVLFQSVCGPQEGRRVSPSPEFETSQSVCEISEVPHGNKFFHNSQCFQGGLAGKFGPKGCLFPCSNLTSPQAVSPISVQEEVLSIQGASLRAVVSPEGFYQGFSTYSQSYSPEGNQVFSLPGRLSDSGEVQVCSIGTGSNCDSNLPTGGVSDKLEEVFSSALSGFTVLGDEDQIRCRISPSSRAESIGYSPVSRPVSGSCFGAGQSIFETFGFDGSLSQSCPKGQALDETYPDVFSSAMEFHTPGFGSRDSSPVFLVPSLKSLAELSVACAGCPFGPPYSSGGSYHRRFIQGVGWTLYAVQGSRSVEDVTSKSPHKCFRDAGSEVQSSGLSESDYQENSSAQDRQCGSYALSEQDGRDEVSSSLHLCAGSTSMVPVQRGYSFGRACGRGVQPVGGLSVTQNCFTDRMVSELSSDGCVIQSLGETPDGFIRFERESQDSGLLQLGSRLTGLSGGLVVHELGRDGCVCISPARLNSTCVTQGSEGRGNPNSDSTKLAQPSVVSSDFAFLDRSSSQITVISQPADSAGRDATPCESGRMVPGSMEDKREYFMAQGLSKEVAQTIIASRATSTYASYESGWKHFSRWCRRRGIDPFASSVPQILNFLQFCLTKKKYAHSTIRNRVFALALYHSAFPLDALSGHPWVRAFLKGAKRLCPKLKDILPKWSLQLVLQSLRGVPFEPMVSGRLKWLTIKTAFLLAIVTAKRVGELQAFSVDDRYLSISQEGVRLRLNPCFIPKVNTSGNREMESFLAPFCPRTNPRSTCTLYTIDPCRAIRRYVSATKAFRQTDQFFVCYQGARKGHAASKMTIARWIRSCIEEAYKARKVSLPTGLKAHQTRSQAATWAQFNSATILDICRTATWADECTFARHYQLNLAGNSSTARFSNSVLQTVLDKRPT